MDTALYARFLRGLDRNPDGTALRAGGRAVTYRELHALALTWAGAVVESGATAVGVFARKDVPAYAGILAALYAGAAVVPLRPDFPLARTRQMVEAAGVTAVVAGEAVAGLEDLCLITPSVVATPLSDPLPVKDDAVAYILFTSGSTGRPKGVVITHAAAHHYFSLLDDRYDFGPEDVFSQTFDLNFDCSLFDLFCAWGAGAAAVPVPAGAYRDLAPWLADNGVTVWFSTPSAIDLVRRTGGLPERGFPGLKWSFFAGEALKCADTAQWQAAAANSRVENLYGPTELTVTITGYRWTQETDKVAVNGVVPIGTVHEGHDWLLLGDNGTGEGELCIAGPQLTPGYLDPADGEGRFLEREGKRYYRTGDTVRVVEGGLAYLGRIDSQLQVGGWRVEPAEIEHALRAAGADDAVVVGVGGDGDTELFAFYTGAKTPVVHLVRGLRGAVPEGLVPRRFHHLDEFPLNTNRKTDRKALTALAARLRA